MLNRRFTFLGLLLLSPQVARAFFPKVPTDNPFAQSVDSFVNKAAEATELTTGLACHIPNITIPTEIITQILGETEKKLCAPIWNKDGTGVDEMCLPYPEFCHKMPKIPSQVFAVFTEGFPCFALNPCFIGKFNEAKKASELTIMKCWFDLALCFFNACYPGIHPAVLKDLILSGKLIESAPDMAGGVANLGKDLVKSQANDAKDAVTGFFG